MCTYINVVKYIRTMGESLCFPSYHYCNQPWKFYKKFLIEY